MTDNSYEFHFKVTIQVYVKIVFEDFFFVFLKKNTLALRICGSHSFLSYEGIEPATTEYG